MAGKPRRAEVRMKAAPQSPPSAESPISIFARSRWMYVAASLAILIPCFWQSRLQAGDLSSHIYNAWLAHLVEDGQAPGLTIARQSTNVLFDCILKGLFELYGADVAQRIAVSCAVLVFVWGAFAFVRKVSGTRPWALLPVLSMLAYGWTFHMGLFNFYLSLGLCFGALALAWDWDPRRLAAAAALMAAAYAAHGLPVLWTLALLAYHFIAGRLDARSRMYLLAGSFAALIVGSILIRASLKTKWVLSMQVRSIVAVDQFWVYDSKYLPVVFGMMAVWGLLLARRIRICGVRAAAAAVPFHFCALTAAGILLVPTWILIPGYSHPLVFLADRMSLALGVCLCAAVAAQRIRPYVGYAIGVLALLFFGCLYIDESALNGLENRMQRMVNQLPPGQRVVSGITREYRVIALAHMIDRVCLGRCYSYANYEPSSAQFRIRATGPNPIVVSSNEDADRFALGTYTVKERDLPLYQVLLDTKGQMAIRRLSAGDVAVVMNWER
jgi:hypothetical protein